MPDAIKFPTLTRMEATVDMVNHLVRGSVPEEGLPRMAVLIEAPNSDPRWGEEDFPRFAVESADRGWHFPPGRTPHASASHLCLELEEWMREDRTLPPPDITVTRGDLWDVLTDSIRGWPGLVEYARQWHDGAEGLHVLKIVLDVQPCDGDGMEMGRREEIVLGPPSYDELPDERFGPGCTCMARRDFIVDDDGAITKVAGDGGPTITCDHEDDCLVEAGTGFRIAAMDGQGLTLLYLDPDGSIRDERDDGDWLLHINGMRDIDSWQEVASEILMRIREG